MDLDLRKPFYSGEFQKNDQLFLWHGYLAETSSEPVLQEGKFSELKWFEAVELDEVDLAPNLRMILPSLRNILK